MSGRALARRHGFTHCTQEARENARSPKPRQPIASNAPKRQRLWLRAMAWGAHFGCHQNPRRSLFLGRWQLPVCARCFGFLLGSHTALPFAFLGKARTLMGLLALPMAVDGLRQRFLGRPSNNLRRYLSGWLAGFGAVAAGLRLTPKLLGVVLWVSLGRTFRGKR